MSFAVQTQNKDFCTLHEQVNPVALHTKAITTCIKILCDMHTLLGTTKVWAWPMKNITQKPASLFPNDDEAVLVR